jgi:hypothetical protein
MTPKEDLRTVRHALPSCGPLRSYVVKPRFPVLSRRARDSLVH